MAEQSAISWTVTDQPIPLVLDLWSLGHSASDIAQRLDIAGGHKGVTRIVEHARAIGDQRAVYHRRNYRLLGTGIPEADRFVTPLQKSYRGFEIVPLLGQAAPRKPKPEKVYRRCTRGHVLIEGDTLKKGRCTVCKRERDRLRMQARKAAP